jgi:hypothetical protein
MSGILGCSQLFAQSTSFSWAKQVGGTAEDAAKAITSDALGNIYILGHFKGTVDVDPGPGVYNMSSAGEDDTFILKLDAAGNFVWAKRIGGVSSDWGQTIHLDAAGYMYISGEYAGTVDFDPGAGISDLTSTSNTLDIFILKLNPAGDFVWAKTMGGPGHDYGLSVTTDLNGNIYTGGYFWNGTADFDPGPGTYYLTPVGERFDAYISKLDPAGNFVWAKKFGSINFDMVNAIVTDASGNVYTTGLFQSTVDFDPGPGTYNLTSVSNSQDVFVLKLNPSGEFVWAQQMGGNGSDEGAAITIDRWGNLYSTGVFVGTADFDPGPGTFNLTATGSAGDAYIWKLDSSGNVVWAKKIGGPASDKGLSVHTDQNGAVYTSGWFTEKVDCDPGPDSFYVRTTGTYNRSSFILQLDRAGNFLWATGLGGASYNYGTFCTLDVSGKVIALGSFSDTGNYNPAGGVVNLTSAGGNDVFIVKLAPCATAGSANVSACGSYTSPSGLYTWRSTGIYKDTITNAAGCDSVITMNVTIPDATESVISPGACWSYTSPSLKYTWTTSGSYSDTLINSAGCDSIIRIDLTIDTVDVSVKRSLPDILFAGATGAAYQWLDCNAAYAPVAGETGQVFIVGANGNYAVRVTQNECVDTSECIYIGTVGLDERRLFPVTFSPNPTTGLITVDLGSVKDVRVKVSNILGEDIVNEAYQQKDKLELWIPGEAGLYFIELTDADQRKICRKVIRQ